jgi:hypothetical protein
VNAPHPPAGAAANGQAKAAPDTTLTPEEAKLRRLPGYERGNPTYFENEVIDHLLGIVLELGAEIWTLRDRQAFTEELLREKGIDLDERLQNGRPSDALQATLKAEREAMIKRIYGRLYSRYGGDKADLKPAM